MSLGLSPLACGGTALTSGEDPDAQGGAASQAGSGMGGAPGSTAGASHGGGSFGAGASSTGGTPAGGAPGRYCESPALDPASQLTVCKDGSAHRTQSVICNPTLVDAAAGAGGEAGEAAIPSICTSDDQCSSVPLGYCELGSFAGDPSPRVCKSGCITDNDCAAGSACECQGTRMGQCRPSDCRADADCGAGSGCFRIDDGCVVSSYRCTGPADECLTNADCGGHFCFFDSLKGHRACLSGVCGRPFLIRETARLADVAERRDWLELDTRPDLSGLSALERTELATHWVRLGQMEHASIAAFARFSLQLLSLGAPAELVEGCNQALADETAHTRLCFALASHYGGVPVGPGKLEVRDCFEDSGLGAVMQLVISEGCIGETVAALEAMEQALTTSDPVVRNVLLRIAKDEQRHAELAYRFMRWALTQASDELRARIECQAEARIAEFEVGAEGVRFIAARDVVRPLLAALLAGDSTVERAASASSKNAD